MSDIAVTLDQPNYGVNLGGNVAVTLAGSAISANLGAHNISVNLGGNVTVNFPMGIQFDMDAYNAALLPFMTNADAYAALGADKEFVYEQGSTEAPQGIKAITYTP